MPRRAMRVRCDGCRYPFALLGNVPTAVKLEFAGQCPVTARAWQAGNRRQTIGPARFVSAAVKLEFIGQCPMTARAWQAGNRRQTIGPARFVSATIKLGFIAPMNAPYFSCFGKKSTKRSRHRRGSSGKCALSYVPLQPHRHPAFKNVPIFERLHTGNLQDCNTGALPSRVSG